MKITFLGATGTVTGSKYLVETGKTRVLIDCGLFQGLKDLRLKNWAPLPINPAEIDAIILTHAHLDHSGYLPLIIKQGFKGKIYCTQGTQSLCKILLPDSGYLQEEEARYANRHRFSKHSPALPLYTKQDVEKALTHLHPVAFHTPFQINRSMEISFIPAGHILGAAMVNLESKGKKILFTGDLGRPTDPIMQPPEQVDEADYLIVESTYGNRRHDPQDPKLKLAEIINRTDKRGGVTIIPAFAVGRAQTLLYYLQLLKKEKLIPDLPVFLNSPMAINASHLYCEYRPEHRLSQQECKDLCHVAKYIKTVEESKQINTLKTPAVIISASGMVTGGRILHHLKAYAPDAKNTILLAGFQAAGTRGQTIASGAEAVKIHGEYVPIRAEVCMIDNLSAHADYVEILDWLSHFKRAPQTTFITHGEPAAADAMRRRIEETLHWNCLVPNFLDSVELSERKTG
jgi:metallo-beta-lactamase family protein